MSFSFPEYSHFDAVALAELIRKREIAPTELCEAAIERIEVVNPRLNAVVTPLFEEGRLMAQSLPDNAPFRGVPFLLKDLVEVMAGVRLTMGCRACSEFVPAEDNEMVSRFRRSGVVFLGKTNVPELGLAGVTESELLGPCRNPWNLEHTPGGSSGGSAAAVASGMLPVASANDGGGSIRIPASCCGLFGLKPSRGRTPSGPFSAELWQGAACCLVVSRTVRDSAAFLDEVSGPEKGSPYSIEPHPGRFLDEVAQEPGRLRIAFSVDSPANSAVHPECVKAVEKTASLLEDLGHVVEERAPDLNWPRLFESFFCLVFAETAADLMQLRSMLKRRIRPSDVEPVTWMIGALGKAASARDLALARRFWGAAGRKMGRFHEEFDLYLTPTMACPPARIGELDLSSPERAVLGLLNRFWLGGYVLKFTGMIEQIAEKTLSRIPFTQLANLTGQPAMSVPMHWTPEGLPIGVQFMAPLGDEAILLRLAGQLERSCQWWNRKPPVWAG